MKRVLFIICFLILAKLPLFSADSCFSAGLGFDFFNYQPEEKYLSICLTYFQKLGGEEQNMTLDLGFEFGLTVEPRFIIPLTVGLNFYFPIRKKFDFFVGFGLTPVFIFTAQSDSTDKQLRFYLGPFLKTGCRLTVHHHMKLFIKLEQDLLIGPPSWINTVTRVHGGVNFSLP